MVSDHGFSTVDKPVDVTGALVAAGFHATREFHASPASGDVLVMGLGGSVFLYVTGHDQATIARLATFLQGEPFTGVVFTSGVLPGTFGLDAVRLECPAAPDLIVAMRWNDEKNANGLPGLIYSEGRKAGQGNHATLSRYELHNTLIAAGPDFRSGFRDEMPSSNIDLAPTIAHLLKLPNAPTMDGRVLTEGFAERDGPTACGIADYPSERRHAGDRDDDRLASVSPNDHLRRRNVFRRGQRRKHQRARRVK